MNALNSRKHRKLILLNVLVALALVTFLISILGDGFDLHNANGQTANLMAGNVGVEYNNRVFDITDVSIKYDDVWGPTMIGLIENKDPFNKIEGVQLSVQMYDSNDHLIGVMKGYPQSSNILPNQKTAFEIQSGDEDIQNVDHVFIEILATDWGTSSSTPPTSQGSNSPDPPYMGIDGVSLDPDLSKQIGLNDTKGVLLTQIAKDSPAEKSGLRAGSNTTMYNGSEINIGGDIIQKIDDREVSFMHDIIASNNLKNVGDNVTLTILRDNATKNVDVTLGQKPSGPTEYPDLVYNGAKFSMKMPGNWTYTDAILPNQVSSSGILLIPTDIWDVLIKTYKQDSQNSLQNIPFYAFMVEDTNYPFRNVPLEVYAQHRFNSTSEKMIPLKINATIDGEKALKFYGTVINNSAIANQYVGYFVFHDGVPYMLEYYATLKDFEKYLPQFEQMVKSFRFVGSPSDENGDNSTNTRTNFSGVNAGKYNTALPSENLTQLKAGKDSNYPEELYDECVNVAGKSTCDFLFKR